MEETTFNCLYCSSDKSASESSLEHAVPQFMGGDFAPSTIYAEEYLQNLQ